MEAPVAHVLAISLRIRLVRWLLARFRLPRPEHLERLSPEQFVGYVKAIGMDVESQAALAEERGALYQGQAEPGVRGQEGRTDRPAGSPVS